MDSLMLLALGFTIGLSGALIPGPLLVYTLNESLKNGRWAGAKIILGHAIVEVIIIGLMALGLKSIVSNPLILDAVSVLGGLFILYMAYTSYQNSGEHIRMNSVGSSYGLVFGGIVFTAFNPSFPLWWLTVGARMLVEGFSSQGYLGALIIVLGHWLADLGWYLLVSHTAATRRKSLVERGWYIPLRKYLSILLAIIGFYFISTTIT